MTTDNTIILISRRWHPFDYFSAPNKWIQIKFRMYDYIRMNMRKIEVNKSFLKSRMLYVKLIK